MDTPKEITASYHNFRIAFKASNGDPVVLDENGDEIDPTFSSLEFASAAGSGSHIRQDNISAGLYRGSHFYVLVIGGAVYRINLPH